jgi:hypothetical protein
MQTDSTYHLGSKWMGWVSKTQTFHEKQRLLYKNEFLITNQRPLCAQ